MADPAIAKYLSENIGGVLSKALGEMAVAQPSDGVDFLAQWLKVHIEQEEAKGQRAEEEAKLLEARKKTAAKLEEKAAKKAVREAAAAKREAVHKDALAKFSDEKTTFEPVFWQDLLKAAQAITDCKASYLGLVEEDGLEGEEGPLIRYTEELEAPEAPDGSKPMSMLDKTLKKELREGVNCLTWGAVTENPDPEATPYLWKPPQPEPQEPNPDDPDAAPEAPPPPPYLPVSVPCVTDAPDVHYFEMTRLGAYLAVPLVYNSYYTQEALEAARAFEKDKKEKQALREEKQKEYDEKVEEARASGGEEAVAAVEKDPILEQPEEEAELVMPGKLVKMVLCMDTLGTNAPIDESKIETLMELCKAIGRCKEATEATKIDDQALEDIDEEGREKVKEKIAEIRKKWEEEEEDLQAQQDKELEDSDEISKDLIPCKYQYRRDMEVLLDMKEKFLELKKWVWAPQEMMDLIAAVCFLYGKSKADIYPKRKPNLNWQVLLEVLDDTFFDTMYAAELEAERTNLLPEQKLSAIKALVPAEFDSEKVSALSPALELLHKVFLSAVAYREKSLQVRKAVWEKMCEDAKAAVEEGETPEEIPPPVDDDFEEAQ